MSERVTVNIEGVDPAAITDTLIAIERADAQGVWDQEQHDRLGPLVLGLRASRALAHHSPPPPLPPVADEREGGE